MDRIAPKDVSRGGNAATDYHPRAQYEPIHPPILDPTG
jgi:hypothetical protein